MMSTTTVESTDADVTVTFDYSDEHRRVTICP